MLRTLKLNLKDISVLNIGSPENKLVSLLSKEHGRSTFDMANVTEMQKRCSAGVSYT